MDHRRQLDARGRPVEPPRRVLLPSIWNPNPADQQLLNRGFGTVPNGGGAPLQAYTLNPIVPRNANQMIPRDLTVRSYIGEHDNLVLPLGFCLGVNNTVLVADTEAHRICVFNLFTTRHLSSFGKYGTGEGNLCHPRKIAMMPQYVRSVADNPCYLIVDHGAGNRARLQIFTIAGGYIRTIPLDSTEIVSGLTATQDRRIVLVDSIRSEVLVLSEFGERLIFFNIAHHIKEPGDIAVHASRFYITDFTGHAVCVFNEDGEKTSEFGQGMVDYPNGIEVSDNGDIMVADSHGNQLHINIFDPNGRQLAFFALPAAPDNRVSGLVGLKFTAEGFIVVLTKTQRRLVVLEPIAIQA